MKRLFTLCIALCVFFTLNVSIFAEQTIQVKINPGSNWLTKKWFFIIPKKNPPQIAVWIEDTNGNFIKNLYVTSCSANETWIAAPKQGRPEALPVWYDKTKRETRSIDIVSSASTRDCFEFDEITAKLETGKAYTVYLEVNASFDYNESWPKNAKKGDKNYSGVNGQPSLIYKGEFIAGTEQTFELKAFGIGSIDGSNGQIVENLGGLTTALNIIEDIYIFVK